MSGNTERLNTALAGRYRIERQLGQGGMATVYLAQDIKHDRKVAVKVLKPELAAVLGAERFVVEIKTTAALQHPHILPLFDSGTADGFLYYVMPYIEGETLRGKLNRETQFSVDEAVRIAAQVADALDYAHRHGVIHRDIKPENILLHDGRPMVADFGIALAVSAAAGGRMTETGLSLGTPHYMSPEQATAEKEITARSDVYSIGSVLFEMLTGNPPHTGASAQQIIMKIITESAEPVTKYRKAVPPNVAAAVAQSLEKLPADRFETAKAFAEALVNRTFTSATYAGTPVSGLRSPVFGLPFVVAVTVAVVALVAAAIGWLRPAVPHDVSRFSVYLPDSEALSSVAQYSRLDVSPDGRKIAYVGPAGAGTTRLWLRSLDQLRPIPIAGTEGAINPSFSPSGTHIAFLANSSPRAIKTVPVGGGPVLTLTDSLVDLGGVSWGNDGYIYYDGHLEGDGIARVRETGGKPEIVSRPDSTQDERYHNVPSALPGGRGVLLSISHGGLSTAFDVGVFDLRTKTHKVLVHGAGARYSPSGHLIYVTDAGMLMAAPFDLKRLEITGESVAMTQGVSVRGLNRVDFAIASNGLLAYTAGSALGSVRELVWVSRDGVATPADPAWSGILNGRAVVSPDGKSAAITIGAGAARQVWVKQLDRGPIARVADVGAGPEWWPDGKTVVFSAPSAAGSYRVPFDGSALPSPLRVAGNSPIISRDGKWIVYRNQGNLFGVRTDGDTTVHALVTDPGTQSVQALSPDGKWLAYMSDETGMAQVYVRPFPDTKVAKRLVSVNGGLMPRWSRSGRELFYMDNASMLWSVAVPPGPVFTPGIPKQLFSTVPYSPVTQYPFDVGADDRRFLFSRPVGNQTMRPDELIVVENFAEELRAKVRAKK